MTDADERILNDPRALSYGEEAASTVAAGGMPDPARIERFVKALVVLRRGIAAGTMSSPWLVPTEEDVRRLRQVAGAESGEELAERHRLAKELWARLPQDGLSDAIRR